MTLLEARPRLGGATWSTQRDGLASTTASTSSCAAARAYRGLLERLGVERSRRRCSARLAIPVLAPGAPAAALDPARAAAGAGRTSRRSLLRFRHLAARASACARRARRAASARLDLADPGARRAAASATGSRAQGESRAAIDGFWDLLIRPTLNAPRRARPRSRSRRRCSRRGCSSEAGGARRRLGPGSAASAPRRAGRGDPAARREPRCQLRAGSTALEAASAARRPARPGGRRATPGRRRDPRRPARRSGGAAPAGGELDRGALARARPLADREPPRRLRPARCCRAPFAAASARPLQWVFDRTRARGPRARPVPRGLALGGGRVRTALARDALRVQFLAGVRARCCRRRAGGASRTSSSPASPRRPSAGARERGRCARCPATPRPGLFLAGAWTDTGWPATMEGAVRSGLAAAAARSRDLARARARGRALAPRRSGRRPAQECSDVPRRSTPSPASRRRRALERGRAHLLALQHGRRLLEGRARDQRHDGRRGPAAAPVPRHPRRGRDARDGGLDPLAAARRRRLVATYPGGPSDLSTTVEAYTRAASGRRPARRGRTCGAPPSACATAAASRRRASSRASGWRSSASGRGGELPALPPELILLPSWFPLNIYDFGCWARQTIVPLTVVAAHRPARALGFSLAELRTGARRERARLAAQLGRPLPGARPRAPPLRAAAAAAPARARRSRSAPSGSCAARRPTAAGAASSRPGSTR